MLLFMEDYYKTIDLTVLDKPLQLKPSIHQNTKNDSFIRTSMLLKRLGVKNYLFPLTLYQQELADIDPFDYNNITPDLAYMIAIEIKVNPWYYFREIVRIPTTGSKPVRYIANRSNMALNWCFFNGLDVGLVQPRQTGKTMSTQALISYIFYFVGYNFDIAMLTKDAGLVQDNVARLKDIRDALPTYLLNTSKNDTERKEGLSYSALLNRYLTFTNSNNPEGADKIGRGMTSPMQHWDELAYFKYIWITFAAAMAATIAASANAKAAGLPHSNIFTTTAGRPDTKSGAYASDLLHKSCRFAEILYDCKNKEDLFKTVQANSYRGRKMVYCVFSHRQLGFSDEWLREVIVKNNASPDEVDRDYLNIWKAGSDYGAINAELLSKISASQIEPLYVDVDESGYMIHWYVSQSMMRENTFKNKSLIVGLDSSEMVGEDYTTSVILDPSDMGVVGTLRCNESNIFSLASRIADFMCEFPKSVLIPECKSTGTAITDVIISILTERGINPWKRIFNLAVQKKHEQDFRDFNINIESPEGLNKKLFGFRTTGGLGMFSRNILYKTVMIKALELNYSRIFDEVLIREFRELTVKNGRIDHKQGGHDDMIIAYLLACYFIFFGKNLHFYGIEDFDFLSEISSSDNVTDKMMREEQKYIMGKIKEMEARIRNAPTNLVKLSYERELKNLNGMLRPELNNVALIASEQVKRDMEEISMTPKGFTEEGMQTLSKIFTSNSMGSIPTYQRTDMFYKNVPYYQ